LSRWTDRCGTTSLYPLAPVDSSLVPDYRMQDSLGIAPFPTSTVGFRRNCLTSIAKFTATSSASDKFRRSAVSNRSFITTFRRSRERIPKRYARVKIKIPRFGLHTFDFGSYNTTDKSGLLNLLPNSYIVEFIQVLYHLEPLRKHILNHICMRELCITCELGFLFHMMNQSRGATAEPRNLLRTLRQVKEASALGLLEGTESSRDTRLSVRIQGLCTFLLQHLSKENSVTGSEDVNLIHKLFGFTWQRRRHCLDGKHYEVDDEPGMTVNMEYPRVRRNATFEELLEVGLNSEKTQRVWCERCGAYRITKKAKSLSRPPMILTIKADVNSEADLDLWRAKPSIINPNPKTKLPKSSEPKDSTPSEPKKESSEHKDNSEAKSSEPKGPEAKRSEAKVGSEAEVGSEAKEGSEAKKGSEPKVRTWVAPNLWLRFEEKTRHCRVLRPEDHDKLPQGGAHFELVSVVSHVSDPPDTDSELNVYNAEHLTAHVAISEGKEKKKQWYLFNGFMISKSTLKDAIEFGSFPWKQPCILVYQQKGLLNHIKVPPRQNPITAHGLTAFLNPESLSSRSVVRLRTFAPLRLDEKVGPGMRVAIDCEFVSVEKEEYRINKKNGKRILVKPIRHSLARISLLRASGKEAGKPLLDDYIVGSEPIVDYLTRYSGIEPGDLDRSISTRHLVTLKSAYLRLRYLADQGVTFIGHGLKSDFMLINIVVPKRQIIDTVEVYHIEGRRMLSLRFLALHVLKMDIQGVTHDSIEDARTAMLLYDRYTYLRDQGKFEQFLGQLYDIGDTVGFKA